ncbi:pyridoxal phosphate-dependent aminotransferase [Campylobacter sp. MIT 19-121]|uniref:pyridoxal phosphate-dependent aminotransferase n=1 Tax=Campylobacter sp. MIT 19-121 TaxID=2703906 RepID=UPI00138A4789|nr:pyridoxal phosphate-dependent aminotransferase [Campylobacter sp. MIT 19-121]NDJ27153.1 pyridoxal phosphate-dependent aminotransferase [Campylobacter sp. MIT 19-121]
MQALSLRTADFTESIIRKMTRICLQHNAINLSQGFPDFDPPIELQEALAKVATKGPHQYAITSGATNFKQALARKASHFMGLEINAEENVLVTCGSTEAMMATMLALVNPGEKVIVFSPFYENYGADAILSGAEPIFVPLNPPEFHFDKDALEQAFKQKPKAIILCNPSNPCGKVFSLEELEFIADLAIKYDVYVITDEVYEHIIFAPFKHHYMAALPKMFERTISCSSLSKTYSITGWRLGYLIASKEIIQRAHKVHDFLTVGAAAPLQEAAIVGLNFNQNYYTDLQNKYTLMKDTFLNGLKALDIKHSTPQGAYFVLVDISEFGYESDTEFCQKLIEKVGVAAVPGSSFFKDGTNTYIRFHFAKKLETLHEALNRLEKMKTLMRK